MVLTVIIMTMISLAVGYIMYFIVTGLLVLITNDKIDICVIEIIGGIITLVIMISVFIFGCKTYIDIENNGTKAYIEKTNLNYELYLDSIDNEKLSGLERFELIKSISEYNEDLAYRKSSIDMWYNKFIKDEYKQSIKELKYIKLD